MVSVNTVITLYNLSVKIESRDGILLNHIKDFLDKYYTLKQRSFSAKGEGSVKLFAGKVKNQGVYQLHVRQFVHLYQHLKEINYPLSHVEKIDERDYKIVSADFAMRSQWTLREHQIAPYEFLLDNPTGSKLIPLQTGQGKGMVSLSAIAALKKRTGVIVLNRFAEKWAIEIAEKHEASLRDIMMVQGSKALRAIIAMGKDNELTLNYLIFSAETIQSYLSAYEEDPESCIDYYGCAPIDLFPLLGIGVMLNDEGHMSWHLIFRIIIYTNVEYQIGLSATMLSDERVIRRMYKVVYPTDRVYGGGEIKKYTDLYAIRYTMMDSLRKFVKTSNFGSTSYSHTAFEMSVLRKSFLLDRYLKLIHTTAEDYYISDYQDKDKLLIFVSTIQLATTLVGYLREHYPDKVVNRYCDDDPYEHLMESDIIVSTQQSAGTAVDIPHLRVVIQSVSVSSIQANLQNFGRLRELKGLDTKYCYLYCDNIPKQKDYHLRRVELFQDRALSISYRQSRVNL